MKKDSLNEQVVLNFVPTVLDMAGIDPAVMDVRGIQYAKPLGLPGRSLRPIIEHGDNLPPRPAIVEYDEDWFPPEVCRMRTIVTERYKMTVYINTEDGLLYDLLEDPYEQKNLWFDPSCSHVKQLLMEQMLRELIRTDRWDTKRMTGA